MSENRRPAESDLRDLYITQRLTTRQIGKSFDVDKTYVCRWLHFYGIPPRDGHNGLMNKGIQPPTPEELRRWIHVDHMSQSEIAARFGVHQTAVTFWLRKYGIPSASIWQTRYKDNTPTLPTRDELERMYVLEGRSCAEIGSLSGCSDVPILRLCAEYGIPRRDDGWNRGQRFLSQDGHRVRSTYELRVDDWLSSHNIPHVYEPSLPFGAHYRADFLANGWYIECWGVKNNARYAERKARKLALYRTYHLPLIEIHAYTFSVPVQDRWHERLEACLAPTHQTPPS